jgi:nitrous oxidase accessory protein NosD
VHFVYNTSILVLLAALFAGFRFWEPRWREARPVAWTLMTGGLVIQTYHVVEHTEKLEQWLANGHRSPTPGLLGKNLPPPSGRNFSLIELHFVLNTAVLVCVLGAYVGFRLHRRLWRSRTPLRLAVVTAVLAAAFVGTGAAWSARPPTIRLAAGVHQGPLVVDRAERIVGEPGAIVRAGVVVTANDVVLRDIVVEGAARGIQVLGAEGVVLENVTVRGALVDGISVRRGSVSIRGCSVRSFAARAQGVDISFSMGRPMSTVKGCLVEGGAEGIVTHMAKVRIERNRVSGTHLRGISVTEMSMGHVANNRIEGAVGIGIFCGDYSMCAIERNLIAGTRSDGSGLRSRSGWAIQAHYGASALIRANRLAGNARGIAAFINAEIRRG